MSIPAKILNYLEKQAAKYDIIEHRKVYTAYDAAQTLKRKINEIAKNLLVKADKDYIMAVLPADKNLDLQKLKALINKNLEKGAKKIKKVEIPKENVMKKLFKVKPGAMPAFGKPNKLQVYLDKSLTKAKKAVFSSGSFTESIEMALKDYLKLEEPIVGIFSKPKKLPKKIVKKVKKTTKPAVKKVKKTVKKTGKEVKKAAGK